MVAQLSVPSGLLTSRWRLTAAEREIASRGHPSQSFQSSALTLLALVQGGNQGVLTARRQHYLGGFFSSQRKLS